ncbi:MAG: YdcF family protein [Proteobacteria bacterium]|nr:YdcF family protein [Pseudomonadota bacterium]
MLIRYRRKSFGYFSWLLAAALLPALAWCVGLFLFADAIPKQPTGLDERTDAVVVLTGGSGRVRTGLNLLLAERADLLFVSGVYHGVDVSQLLAAVKQRPGDLEKRIGIGNAVNTIENATETAAWMRTRGLKSLRLVTSAYHMPRSLLEFSNAMPDIRIVPNPVFPTHVKSGAWWAWPGTAALTAGEYSKFLLAWMRHQFHRVTKIFDDIEAPS